MTQRFSREFPKYFSVCLIFMLFLAGQVFAQTTGKITGTITSAEDGEPLAGANVIVVGTYLGAAADLDGYFTIVNVPPGNYDVQVTMMGFQRTIKTDVKVSIDQITNLEFNLGAEVVEGEEVVVTAERDILHKEVSNSQLVVSNAEMVEAAGIRTINHYLEKQAGVTGENHLEIRGGSADQTGTVINGLTFVNPRVGTAEAGVPISAVEEVSLVTGGYSAEHGNFRSGLVNIVTKSGDKEGYHGSFNYSRNNPHMKRFGKSLYDPSNVFLLPLFDPEVAFIGTRAAWPSDEYPVENEEYILFAGWDRMALSYNRSAPEDQQITPLEMYLWSAWMYMVEPDWDALRSYCNEAGIEYTVTEEQKKAIQDHAHEEEGSHSDYNLDFGFGGPLPFVSDMLGDATFYFSHQTVNTNYIQPVTLNSHKNHTSMLTVQSNIDKTLTLKVNSIYRKVYGTLPVMPTAGAVPSLGDINDADSGGGGFMYENNLSKIYDQGHVYFWHPTFWHPKDQTISMTGLSLNKVVNQKTFWDLALSYTWQKDFAEPEVTRNSDAIVKIGPVWLNEMPYGRTFTADTVYNPNDLTDFYIHGLFEDVGADYVGATGRRFSGKTGQYHENSITQQLRAKFDLSSQVTKHHFIKTGFDFSYVDLNNDLWVYWRGYDTDYDLRIHRKPWQSGVYIQDQITYEGIVARLGLRADYYNSGGDVWPTGNRYVTEAFVEGAEGAHPAMDGFRYDFLSQGINLAWDRMYAIDDTISGPFMEKTKNHFVLSPRIGISFPVTENSKFYFNYGHFRSTVPYSEMFMYNYRYSKGQGLNYIGNPNLAPPRTISYELGGSINILKEYLLNISGFYKDVTGQHTTINFDGASISDGYASRTNNQYEDIQGLEVDIRKPVGQFITGWINFRYLLEKSGNVGRNQWYEDEEQNSDPTQIYYEASESRPAPRPKVAANLTFHVPKDLKLGEIGNSILGDWLISGIFEWEQGRAFTHNPEDLRNVSNNLRWPDYYMVDLKISKSFTIQGIRANFYVDIQNVLNLKVNWMHNEWCFRSDIDRNDYLNSLHLPMYNDAEYQGKDSPSGTPYVGGNDKVGDLRSDGKDYINNPNNDDLWLYGYPRDIWIGLNISF